MTDMPITNIENRESTECRCEGGDGNDLPLDPLHAMVSRAFIAGWNGCLQGSDSNALFKHVFDEIAADAACALRGADEARQFPDNTCPASRHAQMIGEAFINGEGLLGLDQDMPHIGQSILATVEALYRARTALRGEQKESGWRQVPAWVHDLVLSGDLEPVLMRAGEEATRLGLYRARQELLSSLPSAPTSEGEAK